MAEQPNAGVTALHDTKQPLSALTSAWPDDKVTNSAVPDNSGQQPAELPSSKESNPTVEPMESSEPPPQRNVVLIMTALCVRYLGLEKKKRTKDGCKTWLTMCLPY